MKSFSNPWPLLLQHIPADCEPLPVQDRTDISSHSHITAHPLFSWHIEAHQRYDKISTDISLYPNGKYTDKSIEYAVLALQKCSLGFPAYLHP